MRNIINILKNKIYYRMSEFKFLVTTDNHLGFRDDDHIRGEDSYNAFQESLKIARSKDVDFILLGGDLFHVNRPSTTVERKCIQILREHINSSDKKIEFKKISGSFSHCPSLNYANFEDANLNISYPILTIHGNHDDPTGPNNQSICEKLATSGLLNYFGALSLKSRSITVAPIVLEKAGIKLALYGMGFIPDGKLRAAFERNEVHFKKPPKDTFNILVTHQNRASVNKDRFIPDDYYPKFFNLIIRGHEHETQEPQLLAQCNGVVYQPGSTVATSINTMESLPKKVGLMRISKDPEVKLKYDLIELKSVRPMIVRNIFRKNIVNYAMKGRSNVSDIDEHQFFKFSQKLANETLENILSSESKKHGQKQKMLPIVRIRIEYADRSEKFDEIDYAIRFYGKCTANRDIILFRKQKIIETGAGEKVNITFKEISSLVEQGDDEDFEHINLTQEKRNTIDAMIESYFEDLSPDDRLVALSLKEYTDAVKASLEDGNVIGKVVKTKTDSIMREYEKALGSEELADEQFFSEEVAKHWFTARLRQKNEKLTVCGDKLDID